MAWWFKHHSLGSIDLITTLLRNVGEFCKDSIKTKKCVFEEWISLGIEALKFNIDGSSRGNPGVAGVGGVLRNNLGAVLCLLSSNIGSQNAITTELMVVEKSCSLCISNSAMWGQKIEIVSDSKTAFSWIKSTDFRTLHHVRLVYDIYDLMRNHDMMKILFSSEASNSYVDNLAKRGSRKDKYLIHWVWLCSIFFVFFPSLCFAQVLLFPLCFGR
ncbi:hypothetical protein Ddye_008343 [Dipteronia dyeriana]|uniref:RNase H type-1 domain-containing protein n=1 Tax=Dipteronia dyeriana TaxID=168575 RepID=A0AAD9X986_9ROSI|nr:hypothetical protein Ddye_008343 [Dipteronia dyeriana]